MDLAALTGDTKHNATLFADDSYISLNRTQETQVNSKNTHANLISFETNMSQPAKVMQVAAKQKRVNVKKLKKRNAAEVINELRSENLSVITYIKGDVEGKVDKTDYVLSHTFSSQQWKIQKAKQNKDGKISLTVKAKIKGPLNVENNPDLAALLALKDPLDTSVDAFAEHYKGKKD